MKLRPLFLLLALALGACSLGSPPDDDGVPPTGGTPATPPALQEQLFATGGRESIVVDDFGGDCTITETANTAAGTHDNDEITDDVIYHLDGINDAASGHLDVIYSMDAATFAGTIDFVRYKIHAQHVDFNGSAQTIQIATKTATAGFGVIYTSAATPLPVTTYATYVIDLAVNPATGTPWTATTINGFKHGFQLDSFTLDGNGNGNESNTTCAEFWIEVWGH